MKTEIEAKFLAIDGDRIRERLRAAGADLVQPETLLRRRNFDYPDGQLQKKGGWVRVRDEGRRTTLAYKQLNDRTLHGTQEVSLVVDSFDAACEFVKDIGLVEVSYQETRREMWNLGPAEIVLDAWPWIPPLLEIEAGTEEDVRAATERLGLSWADAVHGSVEIAYQREYDVTEEEIDRWPVIAFTPTPGWLEKQRKKSTPTEQD